MGRDMDIVRRAGVAHGTDKVTGVTGACLRADELLHTSRTGSRVVRHIVVRHIVVRHIVVGYIVAGHIVVRNIAGARAGRSLVAGARGTDPGLRYG